MAEIAIPKDWSPLLASAIAATIREYAAWRLLGKPVVVFDLGCFPWHGSIEVSVLTAEELDTDPVLLDPGELAAWFHYNFGVGLVSWDPVVELGRQMSRAYNATPEGDKSATVEMFLRACATAVTHLEVTAALGSLACDPRFRIRVVHPDDGREFCPPGTMPDKGDGRK